MQYTTLGRSDLRVSRVAFGTWQLGGDWGPTDDTAAIAAIRQAVDEGITLFDTAQGYGFGASERLLARALQGQSREGIVIATKGGVRPVDGDVTRDSSPKWIRQGVEASLRALDTEVIDLYQVPWPDSGTRLEDTAATLADLVTAGNTERNGIGVLIYGPLAHGLLGGHLRHSTAFEASDWRNTGPVFQGASYRRNLETVAALESYAQPMRP
jgi:aryl-alcohol dehydrogenase-like predicted oxidoreductase